MLHSAAAGHRYLQHLGASRIPPAQIILVGSAITLLVDDDVLDVHDLAGDGIPVTVVTADLPALGLDVGDLPAYVYGAPDLSTALRHACVGDRPPTHWV